MPKIFYLCDGKVPECQKNICYKKGIKDGCRHTSDIKHAVNFEKKNPSDAAVYWEAGCGDEAKRGSNTTQEQADSERKEVREMQTLIVKESKLGLELLGKTVTHKTAGEGIVLGYSSISGEPWAFFYKMQKPYCFSYGEIIDEAL